MKLLFCIEKTSKLHQFGRKQTSFVNFFPTSMFTVGRTSIPPFACRNVKKHLFKRKYVQFSMQGIQFSAVFGKTYNKNLKAINCY